MSVEHVDSIQSLEGKYLTFSLADGCFGVSISKILQIIAIPSITSVPRTPAFVRGVINLRGKIIPVVDLRLKFLLPEQEYDDRTSIVIIKFVAEKGDFFIGIIVDKVLEVIDILSRDIEDTPSMGFATDSQYILGMAKVRQKVVTLLDINRILTFAELSQLSNTTE
jgi:purine-binding chemotaxis protein CheW